MSMSMSPCFARQLCTHHNDGGAQSPAQLPPICFPVSTGPASSNSYPSVSSACMYVGSRQYSGLSVSPSIASWLPAQRFSYDARPRQTSVARSARERAVNEVGYEGEDESDADGGGRARDECGRRSLRAKGLYPSGTSPGTR